MEEKANADTLKNMGNEYYRKKDYVNAIECYTRSLDILKTAACFSNRSLCYILLKRYTKAAADATAAISCDPLFAKAWLRRGICGIETRSHQKAYYDLLRANELIPNNKDVIKQLEVCKKVDGIKVDSLDEHVQYILAEMERGFDSGNSNEAKSYVQDVLEYRPQDKEVLDRLAKLLEMQKCWEEGLTVLEKLMELTKDDEDIYLGYMLRHIHVDYERGELETAIKDITYYNSRVSKEKQQIEFSKQIEVKLKGDSVVERALSLVSERMDIPKVPDTLYELVYQLQVLKDQSAHIARYLISLSPEKMGSLFKASHVDVEPYELLIQQMACMLRRNISHCYWVIDCLRALQDNQSFSFIRTMLSYDVVQDIQEMKSLIMNNGKVSEELLSVFDDYLLYIVY